MGRVWLANTTVFDAQDADTAAVSWDVDAASLDFGSGGPVWMQRSMPNFVQNHIIFISDLGHGREGHEAQQIKQQQQGQQQQATQQQQQQGEKGQSKRPEGKGAGRKVTGVWAFVALAPPSYDAILQRGIDVAGR